MPRMRKGDLLNALAWRGLWLCLLLSCPPFAHAAGLVVRQLADDPPAQAVLSGEHDRRLEAPRTPGVIQQTSGGVRWWRIDADRAVPATGSPKLLLRAPFLYRVEAWVPGRDAPTRHALYGEHADPRYSHRALVVDLPHGIPAGEAVWLRVHGRSAMSMPVSLELLDDVHRDDLAFVAWRAFIHSIMLVLMLLAVAFWIGTGERSYGWFGGMLCFAVLYTVSIGGDLRGLPGAELAFGSSPQTNRVVGAFGVVCSNLFQRGYLDLPRKLPGLDRLLWIGTALGAVAGTASLLVESSLTAQLGNIALVLSAALLLAGSAILAWRGDRPGRVVVLSWLPLMVFTTLVAAEMMGLWVGPPWLGQGLAGSFALAGLLLTIGLADKLLQLRRDRDRASRQAQLDTVTKLLNRHGIEERLFGEAAAARARGAPLSIAFVDLDHFKSINDEYGHGVGDQCLRIVSWRLRNLLRRNDAIGRYGGDEFLVVLPDCGRAEAMAIAERMRVSVNCRPLAMADASIQASLSVGVAELAPGESMDGLFERADTALYASKSAGRDRVSAAPEPKGLWKMPPTEAK